MVHESRRDPPPVATGERVTRGNDRSVTVDLDADWRTYLLPEDLQIENVQYLGVVTVGLSKRGAFMRVKTTHRNQQNDHYDYYLINADVWCLLDPAGALDALDAAGAARERAENPLASRTGRRFI